MEAVTQYEVRCERCQVSFPIGTKLCIHCGGRTGSSELAVADGAPSLPPMGPAPEAQAEEEAVRQSPVRVLVTLLWVVLAIAFSVVRSCSEK
jgi:hypothetical protein